MAFNQNRPSNPLAGIIGIAVFAIILYLLFQLAMGIISIIYTIGPILLIIALIMNRHVVFDYIKWLGKTIKKDAPRGFIYSALSVIGYPFVGTFLFFKAFLQYKLKKQVKTKQKRKEEEFVEYEEVEEEVDDFLELPDLEAPKQNAEDSYDDLFEN